DRPVEGGIGILECFLHYCTSAAGGGGLLNSNLSRALGKVDGCLVGLVGVIDDHGQVLLQLVAGCVRPVASAVSSVFTSIAPMEFRMIAINSFAWTGERLLLAHSIIR